MGKVYITYRQSDTMEGRGPMVMDKIFSHIHHANSYIDAQPGVWDRRKKWSEETSGDWKVVEHNVIEYDIISQAKLDEERTEKILERLDEREQDLLKKYFLDNYSKG